MAAYIIVDVKVTDPEVYKAIPSLCRQQSTKPTVENSLSGVAKPKPWKVTGSQTEWSCLNSRALRKPRRGGTQTNIASQKLSVTAASQAQMIVVEGA